MQRNARANEEHFRNSEFRDRLRKRDPAAWEQLYRAYASSLEAVAKRILPVRLDPEGAAQETWERALSKAWRFARKRGSRERPYPWLCSICINRCLSILRTDKTSRGTRLQNSLLQGARLRPLQGVLVREGPTDAQLPTDGPLKTMADAQELDLRLGFSGAALRREVARLSRRLQRVLHLRFTCDLPNSYVAELLGISKDAVRQRLSRAYGVLRKALGEGGME